MSGEQEKIETAVATPAAPRSGRVAIAWQVANTAVLLVILAVQLLRPAGLRHEDRPARPEHRAVEAQPSTSATDAQPGPTLRIADFVVHLRDPDAERYARISFEMELRDEKAKEGVTVRMPLIRDAFLAYLSDRSSDELRGSEAIARIKAALAEKLGTLAPSGGVRALYLTELVVQ